MKKLLILASAVTIEYTMKAKSIEIKEEKKKISSLDLVPTIQQTEER